jgi:hypothetical protein
MLSVALANGTWYYSASAPSNILPTSLASGTVGTAYTNTQFTATGSTPITWSVTSGTLPTGMTFSSSGLLSGTPSTPLTGNIQFTATNSVGSANTTLTLTVNASGGPTLITAPTISVWRAA